MLAWGLKIASFHIEINACESALVVSYIVIMFTYHIREYHPYISKLSVNVFV
jgi:hypothetical protein